MAIFSDIKTDGRPAFSRLAACVTGAFNVLFLPFAVSDADARSYLTGLFPLQVDNPSALAEYLPDMQHLNLGMDYPDKRNGCMASVTLTEVNDAAKEFLPKRPHRDGRAA